MNALSEHLTVTVYQKGKVFKQDYSRGKPLNDLTVIGETDRTGTTIWFKPDAEIFETVSFDFDTLKQRLREMAFLNKGIRIRLIDQRDGRDKIYHYEGGIRSFVEYLNKNKAVMFPEPIYMEGEQEGTQVEVALQWERHIQRERIHLRQQHSYPRRRHASGRFPLRADPRGQRLRQKARHNQG